MNNRLAIFGASGHGKVIAEAALLLGWKKIDFFDDNSVNLDHKIMVIGDFDDLLEQHGNYDGIIVGIGDCRTRVKSFDKLKERGAKIVTIIHPFSSISLSSTIGEGVIICPGAIVGVDVHIGDSVIINTGATVDHDCTLNSGVHISPGANLCGGVFVGSRSWIGAGSVIKQGVIIGDDVTIGAGTVVLSDVISGTILVGNPSRVVSKHE